MQRRLLDQEKTMKSKIILTSLLAILSSSLFAADFFCHVDGKLVSATTENGRLDCMDAFAEGDVCFKGPRVQALNLLSDLSKTTFNWEEQWLEDVHLKGRSEISYDFVDGPSHQRVSLSMKSCR